VIYDFYFTRLMYESGDWDVDIRMPSNVLNSLVEYTTLRVDPAERVIALSDAKMLQSPFCYLAGHKLVQFTPAERRNFERYVKGGGFVFVDDCNHDIDGLFAKSFEAELARMFGAKALKKIPNNHRLYSSFFKFDGPPNTAVELNGWGDDLVHEYLRAIEVNGPHRRAVLEQGLRLRVGLRLPQQALAGGRQYPLCGQHHSIRVGSMRVAEAWTENEIADLVAKVGNLKSSMGQVIIGQKDVIELLVTCLLAGGHALVEGVPGLGKTLLVKSLAQATDMQFRRVQFTPDLMPSDIVGTEILEEDHATRQRVFRFQQGPVFTQVLLADEINRAPPKTQSALLEAMQERSVTFAGQTHKLPRPFFVLATQNPIEQAGTYPLPEAQLDRFLLRIDVGYPTEEEEIAMVGATTHAGLPDAEPAMTLEALLRLQQLVRDIEIADPILRYATRLVRATRPGDSPVEAIRKHIGWGAGPRAGQALVLASKARALMHGRLAVTRDDIKAMLLPVLAHRVLRNFEAEADGIAIADVLAALRNEIRID
jgi:MoxR-like ATPase